MRQARVKLHGTLYSIKKETELLKLRGVVVQ